MRTASDRRPDRCLKKDGGRFWELRGSVGVDRTLGFQGDGAPGGNRVGGLGVEAMALG